MVQIGFRHPQLDSQQVEYSIDPALVRLLVLHVEDRWMVPLENRGCQMVVMAPHSDEAAHPFRCPVPLEEWDVSVQSKLDLTDLSAFGTWLPLKQYFLSQNGFWPAIVR